MSAAKILIVEDEGVVALEIQDQLELLGYEVVGIAITGNEAVRLTAQSQPDLILMDIVLRDSMDGIEAAHQIQQEYDIPVVYLTAHSDEATLQRAKITTPFGYIIKPFNQRDLHITLEMALYKHQMEQKLRSSEQRLRLLVESTKDVILTLNLKGEHTYLHTANQFGFLDEDMIGKTPYDIFDYDTANEVMQRVKKVIATGEPSVCELELFINGQTYWFNEHAYPLLDRRGNVTAVAIIARNVSDIKRLKGILPICAWCGRNIRNEGGQWQRLDVYLTEHADIQVSHGLCPECNQQMKAKR